jgi:hypothetical protein
MSTHNETDINLDTLTASPIEAAPELDLDSLRLSQDFESMVDVQKALVTVPLSKPGRHDWFRVHPDHSFPTAILDQKEQRESYVVTPQVAAAFPAEVVRKMLYLTVTRQGIVRLWPVRMPGDDGRLDPWNMAAHDAAERAKSQWVRISANMGLGAYDVHVAKADYGDPEWPTESFDEILKVAFKGRVISDPDHIVLRRLRGEE